jgi:hypothetical protein
MPDNAYISQVVEEVLYTSESTARVSQAVIEVLYTPEAKARISQVVTEVLRTVDQDVSFVVSVTNSFSVSQNIHPKYTTHVTAFNTLSATQTLVFTRPIVHIHYTSTFSASQGIVEVPAYLFTVNVTNSFSVSQSNSHTFVHGYTVSVNSHASAHQLFKIISPLTVSVTNSIRVTQTVVGINATFYVTAHNTAHVTQINNARNATTTIVMAHTASVHQNFIRRDLIFIVTVSNTLSAKQRINKEYDVFVITTGSVTQNFAHLRSVSKNIVQIVSLTDTYSYTRSPDFVLEDPQTLIESYIQTGSFGRSMIDQLIVKDVYRSAILSNYQVPPNVTGTTTLSTTTMTIESTTGIIVLPAPEYGDTFGAKVVNTIKKSMTGRIYTYVKTNPATKFTLTWILSFAKGLEFRAFFIDGINSPNLPTNLYTLYLWNGEIWQAKLISSTLPQTRDGRWQNSDSTPSDNERMTVTATFEGVQVF